MKRQIYKRCPASSHRCSWRTRTSAPAGRRSRPQHDRPVENTPRHSIHSVCSGATYADIAAALFVSENTVKTHVSSLYTKLAASRRSEALKIARSFHLL
jgi:DNA-binding NarL/FixJ family response regulator